MPPALGCPGAGPPSSEVTEATCRVPSTSFSQAPWYALPSHLCRFRVRSVSQSCFPEHPHGPEQSDKPGPFTVFVNSGRPRNINLVPIDYAFRPRLRGRLTLRGLTLRRNPWDFGESVSHTLYRYSCQHAHFRYLQRSSRIRLHRPTERSATVCLRIPAASVRGLSPVTSSPQDSLIRPVSCYAFFKGWLLLSQPPGCLGRLTCFPT